MNAFELLLNEIKGVYLHRDDSRQFFTRNNFEEKYDTEETMWN